MAKFTEQAENIAALYEEGEFSKAVREITRLGRFSQPIHCPT